MYVQCKTKKLVFRPAYSPNCLYVKRLRVHNFHLWIIFLTILYVLNFVFFILNILNVSHIFGVKVSNSMKLLVCIREIVILWCHWLGIPEIWSEGILSGKFICGNQNALSTDLYVMFFSGEKKSNLLLFLKFVVGTCSMYLLTLLDYSTIWMNHIPRAFKNHWFRNLYS